MKGRLFALVLLLAACLAAAACGGSKSGGMQTAATPAADATPALSDVEFAKDVFRRMAEGDPDVESMLDWESLIMPGGDVAAEYNEIPDEENRAEFRREFIKGFSSQFKAAGGSAETATNWREDSKDAEGRTLVATDSPTGNTLVFTVVREDGRQKVSELAAREKK